MPKFKRFHPVSHDFNRDPEVIELRRTFGDWMALVWLEMLSIADRNDGEIRGSLDSICLILQAVFTSKSRRYNTEWRSNRARMGVEWMSNRCWIRVESGAIHVLNYAKYHRTPEPTLVPSEPNLTKPINSTHNSEGLGTKESVSSSTKKRERSAPPDPALLAGFDRFYRVFPRRVGHKPALEAWLKIAPNAALAELIIDRAGRYAKDMSGKEEEFILHPTTWLNQERWTDEPSEGANTDAPLEVIGRQGDMLTLIGGMTMPIGTYERRYNVKGTI
jgi:hypothetical protein